ncbi:trypsin-like serine protease [Streptomyces flaveolus]|uniref:Trypsin-like serine protease n=1 Tax=Streptomyces flaveolus TaxID=67297 RepID=A0ABV1VTE3_9ACTN
MARDTVLFIRALGFEQVDLVDLLGLSTSLTVQDMLKATLRHYLFFTQTEGGQRAAREFLARLKERTDDREQAISVQSFRAQLKATKRFADLVDSAFDGRLEWRSRHFLRTVRPERSDRPADPGEPADCLAVDDHKRFNAPTVHRRKPDSYPEKGFSLTAIRATAVTAAACATVLAIASPSSAINSYNATPAPERTEVGALVATWDDDGNPATPDRVDWVCSGTMIDADTFLTAAHCTTDWPDNVRFHVSLSQDVQADLDAAAKKYPGDPAAQARAVAVQGTAHSHSDYPGPASDTHDISVVELPAAQLKSRWSFTPAALPTANQLGALGPKKLNSTDWVVAGYGTQEAVNGPGGHTHPGGGVRMKAPVSFNALNDAWVRLAMTAPQGNGGACYGDSGGPNFAVIGGKRILAATTVTGDSPCYATNVTYRLDTPGARAFLSPFVQLP